MTKNCIFVENLSNDAWLYVHSVDNDYRFALGECGSQCRNPLICFGINPSSAEPGELDPTMVQVKKRAIDNDFDGYIMLNLYPLRNKDPKLGVPKEPVEEAIEVNLQQIKELLDHCSKKYNLPITIWAAWGGAITARKRPYLIDTLKKIADITADTDKFKWVRIDNPRITKHPHHPLYLSHDSEPKRFSLVAYLSEFNA